MLATGCCLQSDGLISEASTPTWTRPKTKRRTPESAPGRTCRGLNLAPDTDPAKPTAESQGSRRSQVGWGGGPSVSPHWGGGGGARPPSAQNGEQTRGPERREQSGFHRPGAGQRGWSRDKPGGAGPGGAAGGRFLGRSESQPRHCSLPGLRMCLVPRRRNPPLGETGP